MTSKWDDKNKKDAEQQVEEISREMLSAAHSAMEQFAASIGEKRETMARLGKLHNRLSKDGEPDWVLSLVTELALDYAEIQSVATYLWFHREILERAMMYMIEEYEFSDEGKVIFDGFRATVAMHQFSWVAKLHKESEDELTVEFVNEIRDRSRNSDGNLDIEKFVGTVAQTMAEQMVEMLDEDSEIAQQMRRIMEEPDAAKGMVVGVTHTDWDDQDALLQRMKSHKKKVSQ